MRIGFGYDVHVLKPGYKLVLGGVEIEYELGLEGHSDADVLTHAVMDALLGAAALGDIGKLFPDTDEKYRGISSTKLLQRVGEVLDENGYEVNNIDVTLIAQKPKIAPYTEKMAENISQALRIAKSAVSIKATTTEHLGFEGEGLGMSAGSVCTIRSKQ